MTHAATSRDTIKDLIRDIGEEPILTADEERALGRAIRSPDSTPAEREDAIRELMTRNLRLVVRLAKGLRKRGEDLGDVVSSGVIGLRRAAERFDPESGFKFSTFAAFWVRQAVGRQRLKESNGRPWRVPVHIHGHRSRCQTYAGKLSSQGEDVTIEEAARRLGIGRHAHLFWTIDAMAFQDPRHRAVATIGCSDQADGASVYDFADDDDPDAAERMDRLRMIERFLRRLRPNERRVIRLYYGFDEVPGIRRATGRVATEPGGLIAKHLGISRERVRQIRQSALTKLRQWALEEACS